MSAAVTAIATPDSRNFARIRVKPVTSPEDGYFLEGPSGGHYQNLMNPANVLVGLGLGTANSYGCQGGEEDFTTAPQ
jgi:hypothetical protein